MSGDEIDPITPEYMKAFLKAAAADVAEAPYRYYALPAELAIFGGAERLGRLVGASEVWTRPLDCREPSTQLWSLAVMIDKAPEEPK